MKPTALIITCGVIIAASSCRTPGTTSIIVGLNNAKDYHSPANTPYSQPKEQREYRKGYQDGWRDVARQSRSLYQFSPPQAQQSLPIRTIVDWPLEKANNPYPTGYRQGQDDAAQRFRELDDLAFREWTSRQKQKE